MGITQIGELNDVEQIAELAARSGYSAGEVKTFTKTEELWTIVTTAITNMGAIVMPFLCRDDTGDLCQSGGFAHYCLVFGFGKQNSVRLVYAANYGKYQLWPIENLLESNFAIRDWEKQEWCKVMLYAWGKDDVKFEADRPEWITKSGMVESLDGYAEGSRQRGCKLGVIKQDFKVHEWDPKNRSANIVAAQQIGVMKSTSIPAAEMTKTMKGKCFVV
jgi:hypothetical protein